MLPAHAHQPFPAAPFDRIVSDPAILGGKPIVKGTRLSVSFIVELSAGGATQEQIVGAYPQLAVEDVRQAMMYAARFIDNELFISTRVAG